MAKTSKFISRTGHTLLDLTYHLRRTCRGVDESVARGLVNYLVTVGVVKVIGEHGVPGQRGRRAHVFDWSPESIATHFANIGVPARESYTTPPAEKRVPAAPKAPKAPKAAGADAVTATVAALVEQAEGLVVANLSPVSTDLTVAADVVSAIEAGPMTTELPADVASLADSLATAE
jgi:hypothetical protein